MRKLSWIVLGVLAICVGVGAVWGIDLYLVDHGALGSFDSGQPAPVSAGPKPPHTSITTTNLVLNVVFLLVFVSLLVIGGYLLAKRRTARDEARQPGDADDFVGLLRRRRAGERMLDPIGGAIPKLQPLPEPADPRQLPADVARQAERELAALDAEIEAEIQAEMRTREQRAQGDSTDPRG